MSTPMRPIPNIPLTDRPGTALGHAPRLELAPLIQRRVVIAVDDDAAILRVLVRVLESENYEVLTATSGAEALQLVEAAGLVPDLLITDYAMPVMEGRELAWRMRMKAPALKVLFQTGFPRKLFGGRRELDPDTAFVEKPFSARGVQEAARLLLFGALNPATVAPASPASRRQ